MTCHTNHMDTYASHTEHTLATLMDTEVANRSPVHQAIINLTMQNESFVLQKDEYTLMSYIAEEGSMPWQDGSKQILRKAADTLSKLEIGNTRAIVDKCVKFGYVKGVIRDGVGLLVLTDTGWSILELHELQEEFEDAESL